MEKEGTVSARCGEGSLPVLSKEPQGARMSAVEHTVGQLIGPEFREETGNPVTGGFKGHHKIFG